MSQLVEEGESESYDCRFEPEFNHSAAFIIVVVAYAAEFKQRYECCDGDKHRTQPRLPAYFLEQSGPPIDQECESDEGERIAQQVSYVVVHGYGKIYEDTDADDL